MMEKGNHLSVPGYDGDAKVAVVPEQRRPLHLGAHHQQLLLLLLVLVLLLLALDVPLSLDISHTSNLRLIPHFSSL